MSNQISIGDITVSDNAALSGISAIQEKFEAYGLELSGHTVLVLASMIKRLERDHGEEDLTSKLVEFMENSK